MASFDVNLGTLTPLFVIFSCLDIGLATGSQQYVITSIGEHSPKLPHTKRLKKTWFSAFGKAIIAKCRSVSVRNKAIELMTFVANAIHS